MYKWWNWSECKMAELPHSPLTEFPEENEERWTIKEPIVDYTIENVGVNLLYKENLLVLLKVIETCPHLLDT